MPQVAFPLLNDLYQFTMAQAYLTEGIAERRAVFELTFRKAPHGGAFAVAAGIGPALDFIEGLRFGSEEIGYLRSLGIFQEDLLSRLSSFRFSGEVDAVREGTVVFPREPILRVSAPIHEAQLLETPLLNLIGFATVVATKAARIRYAAGGAEVIEFGCRRAQGPDGALTATRAAHIGGAASTSNLEAGRRWGIPVQGTMGHSYVMAFPSEADSFRAFARAFPDCTVLLIDTDTTLGSGLPNAIALAREMRDRGEELRGVRIDSGDLARLAREVRAAFDAAGFPEVKVVATGDLDEWSISSLIERGAPIDAFGVGTRLAVSASEPALGAVYKLVAVEDAGGRLEPRRKQTDDPTKSTIPGTKKVYRLFDAKGEAVGDVIGLEDPSDRLGADAAGAGRSSKSVSLLEPAFRGGWRVAPDVAIDCARAVAEESLASIPPIHRRIHGPIPYPIWTSPALAKLCREMGIAPPG